MIVRGMTKPTDDTFTNTNSPISLHFCTKRFVSFMTAFDTEFPASEMQNSFNIRIRFENLEKLDWKIPRLNSKFVYSILFQYSLSSANASPGGNWQVVYIFRSQLTSLSSIFSKKIRSQFPTKKAKTTKIFPFSNFFSIFISYFNKNLKHVHFIRGARQNIIEFYVPTRGENSTEYTLAEQRSQQLSKWIWLQCIEHWVCGVRSEWYRSTWNKM